ncbi:MAG: hypothetical protein U0228_25325 [Myxococcaceae bacterium]
MSVTSIRSAITAASKDKRVTDAEAKSILQAATLDAAGKPDGLSLDEARALADFFTSVTQPNASVALGNPARRVLESLFASNLVPVGDSLRMVTGMLAQATPFDPTPKLTRAPSLGKRFEVPYGVDAELPNGPKRTAFVDPAKKDAYVKLEQGGRTTWAGPIPLLRPGAEVSFVPQPFALSVAGGVKVSTINTSSILLSGGIPATGSLSIDLGTGSKITIKGPLTKSWDVFRAIDKALPKGVYARTQARFIQDDIAERPNTDSRVITLAKGNKPGELNDSDLQHARTLQRLLGSFAQGTATPTSQQPKWNSTAGLFTKGSAPLFTVPVGNGRVALVDPKANQVFFAKQSSHSLSSVTGPVTLFGTPAAFSQPNRYFTWENLKLLQERATYG